MSLLDTIGKQISGNAPLNNIDGNQQGALLRAVSGLISKSGGLSGLLSKFHQNGLGQHAQSWVGTGENMAITGEHVQQVFGADQVRQVAEETGTDPGHASSLIAGILPRLVDKLTPQGKQVTDTEAHTGISQLFSGGLGSLFGQK
jgi:uncharacterized protein YidB (DUF937 family)